MGIGQKLKRDQPQRPQIAVEPGPPLELLGRHVGHRPDGRHRVILRVGHQPGQPEIEHPHPAVLPHHHIRRLHVPVDRQRGMGEIQRRPDLPHHGQRILIRERPAALERFLQGFAFDQFRHGKECPVGILDPVHPDNVRVLERGDNPALVFEQPARLNILLAGHAQRHAFRVARLPPPLR